jgi:hypothetical protein
MRKVPSTSNGGDLMRGFDCVHEAHEDVHFSADSDDDLVEQIRQHRDQFHPEIGDDQIREMVTAGAYDEGEEASQPGV